jgi:hypothetical protein
MKDNPQWLQDIAKTILSQPDNPPKALPTPQQYAVPYAKAEEMEAYIAKMGAEGQIPEKELKRLKAWLELYRQRQQKIIEENANWKDGLCKITPTMPPNHR